MRVLSIILSIYVFALSVFPCCEEEGQEKDKVEIFTIAQMDGDENTDMPTEGDFCSPFVGCHCCSGFTLLFPSQVSISVPKHLQIQLFSNTVKPINISLPIWQPPKLG